MDRFQSLTVFSAVAEHEGFARAARHLRLSPPVVTRAVANLEKELGVRLFERSTRLVRLTDSGRQYLTDARRILEDLAAADESVMGYNEAPRGHLRLTAPVLFGNRFVMPIVATYLDRYPQVSASVYLVDRVVNLLEEGMDAGVRIGALPDSSLHAREVGMVCWQVCAAPSYLERFGDPDAPEDLRRHRIIASSAGDFGTEWAFGGSTVRLRPSLVVSTNDGAISAAREGFGITRLLSYQIQEEIASRRLVPLLEEFEPPSLPVNVLFREARYPSARIRSFVDLAAAELKKGLRQTP